MDIHQLLRGPIDMRAVGAFLDECAPAQRRAAVRALSKAEQAALFEAARGVRPLGLADLVPTATAPLTEVIHSGRNSLPAFTLFQKRFCRPAGEVGTRELWGYNHQAMSLFTGPGYFVAYELPAGEVLIDYTRVPPHGAAGWPAVLPNSARLSRFVYYETQDTLRAVSQHVSIGRAARHGQALPNWFALCREDGSSAS
jgi:hypothetical protein